MWYRIASYVGCKDLHNKTKENIMKTKTMVRSIVTTMVVMLVFASTAMAINVDGKIDPSDEWDGDWSADDSTAGTLGDPCSIEDHLMENWGYNMKTVSQHYDRSSNTLYFRLDVCGIPADLNGDGDVNGPCNPPQPPCDCDGVGAYEQYEIQLSSSGYPGVNIRYTNNVANSDSNAQWGADCIEFSLVNADTYVNPYDYCMFLSAGGIADPPYSEDLMDACYKNDPPDVVCNFIRLSCKEGELSGEGSADDGEIVEYAWDFDNDGDYDAFGKNVSYNIVGTHEVRLMVTDDLGQTANCTLTATVTPDPNAVLTADGGDEVKLPGGGKTVTFDGTGSTPVSPAVLVDASCNLVIPGVGTYTGLGPWDVDMDLPCGTSITATLTVVDNFGCETQDTVVIRGPICVETPTPPPSEVPLSTPVGMLMLVGLLGIAGGIRLLNRGKKS
jgi:hypothetical protein